MARPEHVPTGERCHVAFGLVFYRAVRDALINRYLDRAIQADGWPDGWSRDRCAFAEDWISAHVQHASGRVYARLRPETIRYLAGEALPWLRMIWRQTWIRQRGAERRRATSLRKSAERLEAQIQRWTANPNGRPRP